MLQQKIVEEARKWKETPYKHQGRTCGRACDCAGVLIGVAENVLGIKDIYDTRYGRNPENWQIKSVLDQHPNLITKDRDKMKIGDIVLMSLDGMTSHHVGIISDYSKQSFGLVHCYSSIGRVVEHRLNKVWNDRIQSIYEVVES